MTKQTIIERTINVINQLPEEKDVAISDFADFMIKRYEENISAIDIQQLVSDSQSFAFLKDEDLYSEKDLKEVYNG